jgi:hypothetical protein
VGWAKGGKGEREVVERFFETCTFELFILKTTTHNQTKQMQRHECIKHLVNSKFKCGIN